MEVASGEHGEHVPKLVTAVANGKCNNLYQTGKSALLQPGNEASLSASTCDCGKCKAFFVFCAVFRSKCLHSN